MKIVNNIFNRCVCSHSALLLLVICLQISFFKFISLQTLRIQYFLIFFWRQNFFRRYITMVLGYHIIGILAFIYNYGIFCQTCDGVNNKRWKQLPITGKQRKVHDAIKSWNFDRSICTYTHGHLLGAHTKKRVK